MSIAHDHEQRADASQQSDILRTAADIGRVLGLTPRQAHHLASSGVLKSIRKVGGRYWASRSRLLREVGGE
jgi:hypothetical protein